MSQLPQRTESRLAALLPSWFDGQTVRWVALLGLCAAYLQGGMTKLIGFEGAIAEMRHFGLSPATLFAAAVIALELGASAMILLKVYRWIGALALAGFTFAATFLANRFWELPLAERTASANSFFEHLGLVGGFLLVAWVDIRESRYISAGQR